MPALSLDQHILASEMDGKDAIGKIGLQEFVNQTTLSNKRLPQVDSAAVAAASIPPDPSLGKPTSSAINLQYRAPLPQRNGQPLPSESHGHDTLSEVSASISAASLHDNATAESFRAAQLADGSARSDELHSKMPTSPGSAKDFPEDEVDQTHSAEFGINRKRAEEEEKGLRPAWAELKTKAGKERKRLPLACIACRRKKIRCSGEKPACKHCLRSRIPCVYKVTTRKPAPRTDYMTMLDKRLKRMEERVIKIIPDQDAGKLAAIGRASVKPAINPTPKAAGAKKRAAEEAFGTDLNEWANGAPTGGLARQFPNMDPTENRLLTEGLDHLPPKEIQEHLAEVFFDYLYGQSYHVLHKPSFMRKLR